MKSYRKAFELGVDYLEQDLQLSKDNKLVCIHDATIDRTTNGSGKVSDYTLAELQQFDAGDGEKIPSLDEVIKEFGKKTKYYIETKNPRSKKMDDELIKVLKENNLIGASNSEQHVVIQSFSEESLRYIKSKYSNLDTVYLRSDLSSTNYKNVSEFADGLGVKASELTMEVIDNIKESGLVVHPWTVDDLEDMEKLLNWGVEGIFTNYPNILIDLLDAKE